MDNWYIKIHRKILDWEWYDDINTKILFLHILLKANWEDKKRHWVVVKRWQLLTWRKALALELGLTEQNIRTSLNKLKSTNEITIKSTKTYSIIEAINYDNYQQQLTNKSTNNQPTTNQQLTTTKELKELKELKEDNINNTEQSSKKDKIKNEIDEFQELLKEEVTKVWLAYQKWKYERERIKNILTWKDFWELAERVWMTRQEFAINIMKISLKLDFWNWKIYNATTIYKNYAMVYNEAIKKKLEIEQKKNRKITVI